MDRRLEDRNLFRLRLSRSGRGHRPGPVPRVPQARRGSKPLARPAPPLGALRTRRVGRWPFVMPEPAGLQGTVPRGRGKRTAFPVPARRGVLRDALSLWQGPSPLPKRRAGIRTSRGPQPPASARPAPGGRWPFVVPGPTDLQGTVPRGRGKRGSRFLFPPEYLAKALSPPARISGESTVTASLAGAIAPATALRRDQDRPGATAPGQRPTRPWRALRPRRVGRWPFVVPGPTDLQGIVARGRGKRGSRFLVPPGGAKALAPLHWQGPSPLAWRCAGIRTSRGPKPPASARPAPGGRFAPAGPGAGLRSTCGKGPHAAVVPDRAGKPAVIRGRPGRASRLCGGSAGCSPAASGGDAFQNPVDGTRASAGPGRAGPGQP